jgi:hypothetical protein
MTRFSWIILAAVLSGGSAHAVELDPKAVVYTLP